MFFCVSILFYFENIINFEWWWVYSTTTKFLIVFHKIIFIGEKFYYFIKFTIILFYKKKNIKNPSNVKENFKFNSILAILCYSKYKLFQIFVLKLRIYMYFSSFKFYFI